MLTCGGVKVLWNIISRSYYSRLLWMKRIGWHICRETRIVQLNRRWVWEVDAPSSRNRNEKHHACTFNWSEENAWLSLRTPGHIVRSVLTQVFHKWCWTCRLEIPFLRTMVQRITGSVKNTIAAQYFVVSLYCQCKQVAALFWEAYAEKKKKQRASETGSNQFCCE